MGGVRLRSLVVFALVASACAGPTLGVRVTFDDDDDARAASTVEVALVASCPADPAAEPVSPTARTVATRTGSMALPSVPVQRYGLLGRAWSAECGVVAAGCVDVDLSGGSRTLDVTLRHVDVARCVTTDLCTASAGACATADAGPRDDGGAQDADATSDAGDEDAGDEDAAGIDAGPRCPALASRTVVEITAPITSDTTWDCSHTYALRTEISVVPPAVLTVEPSTVVTSGTADGHTGAILVERGAQLVARGTESEPITFTSLGPAGTRRSGDWGGILMSGLAHTTQSSGFDAIINTLNGTTFEARRYGPTAAGGADDEHSCGVLEHVHIAFAGGTAAGAGDTFAALTLAGCGRGTVIDHVQLHRVHDDGLLIYGGSVDLRHVLVSASEEDVIDWNYGWNGRAQFVLGWQWPVAELGEAGREGGNLFEADGGGTPASSPTIYNLTFLGSPSATESPMLFASNTAGELRSMLVDAPSATLGPIVNVCGAVTAAMSGALSIDGSMILDHFATPACTDSFDERAWACGTPVTTGCATSIGLDFAASGDYSSPSFASTAAQRALCTATPPTDGFFEAASHCGAIGTDDWTAGWTSFEQN